MNDAIGVAVLMICRPSQELLGRAPSNECLLLIQSEKSKSYEKFLQLQDLNLNGFSGEKHYLGNHGVTTHVGNTSRFLFCRRRDYVRICVLTDQTGKTAVGLYQNLVSTKPNNND